VADHRKVYINERKSLVSSFLPQFISEKRLPPILTSVLNTRSVCTEFLIRRLDGLCSLDTFPDFTAKRPDFLLCLLFNIRVQKNQNISTFGSIPKPEFHAADSPSESATAAFALPSRIILKKFLFGKARILALNLTYFDLNLSRARLP
jgi:hypothetical protein